MPALASLAAVLAPLNILVAHEAATFAGTDVEELRKAGVPIMRFSQDARHYFDVHHSPDDTLNKVDRAELNQNVAAWASFVYLLADSKIYVRGTHAREHVEAAAIKFAIKFRDLGRIPIHGEFPDAAAPGDAVRIPGPRKSASIRQCAG